MNHLALCLALALPAAALASEGPQPSAWTHGVQPLEAVEQLLMPPVDVEALKAEDDRHLAETGLKDQRYATNLAVDLTPETAGTWERLPTGEMMWRLRVFSKGARSLNFGFDKYEMPAGGRLFIYSPDRKHVYRPFTAEDNEDHGQLWTPPVFGAETVLEVTIPEAERAALKLHLAYVNHDYRGFGQPGMEKSGACNIDIVCPVSDPFNDQERANGVISTGGTTFCSGSLLNNTANDARPFFMTADHCLDPPEAPSLVVFWNYYNSTCRPQGTGQSPPGDGSLSQFNTGSIFRAELAASDFHLVELDDPLSPAFNLYLAGWDRTDLPAQFTDVVGIHHPNTDEMRISFTTGLTQSGGWPPTVPGDGSHLKTFWAPGGGVTEPGSSGSPIYTQQKRFVGQLHGGASFCGGADLTDFYGRFSRSWVGGGTNSTRASNWLDPLNTGVIVLDGRNACTFPAAPTGVTATATAPNTIQVTWAPVAGATSYNVLRAVGACPQTSYTQVATGVTGTSFNDTTVSGGITYSYVVQSVVAGCPSLNSACSQATATGGCTLPPTFAGITSATSAGTPTCGIDLAWGAATPTCPGTTVKYNVYRSTTPGTPPSAATLLQSCLTTLTFSDTNVTSGTRYYYIVRAEDSGTIGTGPCNSGNQDANVVEGSAVPGGPAATLTDDVESGNNFWSTTGGVGSNVWNIVTTQSNSPTHSWFVADPSVITDQRLTSVAAGNIPAGFVLSFFHRFDTENTFDGHVLEYSLDGGTTWTDILAAQGSVPANLNRFLQGGYNSTISTSFGSPIGGRRAWSNQQLTFAQVRVDMADFSGRDVMIRIRFASDNSVADVGVWIDDITFRFPGSCTTGPPAAVVGPQALAIDTPGNGVFQPNETVQMAPTWRNLGAAAVALTGSISNHTGPGGATYSTPDTTADYGTIAVAGQNSCTVTGNCYSIANTVTTRPLTHWDSAITEVVTPTATSKSWTLHIGDSFTDVLPASPFYRFVETMLHKNVTGGCSATAYCPAASTTREQMAVFVLVSKEAPGYTPAACGATPMFADVPVSSPFCRWVEELARRGVVSGCGGGNYCPASPATREQMAVFVLRTLDPALNPPACGTPMFADVPASSPFCRWIEELARRAVVTGCGGGNYCPAANVTREQMSVFLAVTFGLSLYGL